MGKAIIIEGDFSNKNIGKVTFIQDLKLLESLSISGGNVTDLLIGETTQLTAVFTPAGTAQTNIEWSVNDEEIATVDSNGLVTCMGAGELRVTVQSLDNPTIHAEKDILCVASRPITGITINGESNGIVDDTIQLTANLTPSNTTEAGILWESDNNTIAEVTQSGLVTLKSVGTVKIIATSLSNELVYDELIITVAAEAIPVDSITVNGTTPIEVGNTEQFSVTYSPNNTTEVGVVWTSSNQNVATVNSNGLVTAIGAGTATITATSIHRQVVAGTKEITITPQVIAITGLSITGGTAVDNGSTLQLGIAYTPSNTTQQGVTWSSSDETKATVNSSGLVTAIAEGAVVITATSTINGAISDTHNININAATNPLQTMYNSYLMESGRSATPQILNMITELDGAGVLSKIDALYYCAGSSFNNAKINIKNPTGEALISGHDLYNFIVDADGIYSDGTYAGVLKMAGYPIDGATGDCSFGVFMSSVENITGKAIIGMTGATSNHGVVIFPAGYNESGGIVQIATYGAVNHAHLSSIDNTGIQLLSYVRATGAGVYVDNDESKTFTRTGSTNTDTLYCGLLGSFKDISIPSQWGSRAKVKFAFLSNTYAMTSLELEAIRTVFIKYSALL